MSTKKESILFFISVTIASLILLWRLPFGTGNIDEPLFLTYADRIVKGDSLLSEEWHLGQLVGILTAPILKIYRIFFQSTDGIILNFRYVWLFFHLITTLFIFVILNRYKYTRMIACLFYLYYIPNAMPALSYNTINLGTSTLFFLLITTMETFSRKKCFIAGILLAFSVLCCPYQIILYLFFILTVICRLHCTRLNTTLSGTIWLPKTWLYITLGSISIAIPVLFFVLSRASLSEIMNNLHYIFADDSHVNSFFQTVLSYFTSLLKIYNVFFLFWIIVLLVAIFDSQRYQRPLRYIWSMSLSISVYVIFICTLQYENFIMLPIIFMGILAHVLTKSKNHSQFTFIFLGGAVYAFCKHASSTTLVDAISMSTIPMGIVSILLCIKLISEISKKKLYTKSRVIVLPFVLLFFIQIMSEIYMVASHTGFQVKIWDKTNTTLNGGPLDGIIVPEEEATSERLSLEDIAFIKQKEAKKILFVSNKTWFYLFADMEYATPSAFSYITNDYWMTDKINEYYELHPDKIPDYIYIEASRSSKQDLEDISNQFNYSLTITSRGYFLEKTSESPGL